MSMKNMGSFSDIEASEGNISHCYLQPCYSPERLSSIQLRDFSLTYISFQAVFWTATFHKAKGFQGLF